MFIFNGGKTIMIYKKNTANYPRLETDVFFTEFNASQKYIGYVDEVFSMIQDKQLLDVDLWKAFIKQFESQTDKDMHWRGEFWGKMMRGASFVYSYSKNEELYALLSTTVNDMLSLQESSGRLSSYPVDCEFDGWDLWCRKYVLLGLQYFLEICTDADLEDRIINSMCCQVDYIIDKIGSDDNKIDISETSRLWRGLNSSSILEPVVRLYSITQKERYLEFAKYLVESGGIDLDNLFELAYENNLMPYQYPVTKAYEMISCFEGVLEYYRVTKEEKYKKIVVNFANRILESDFTVIGSCGCSGELLDHSTVRQANTTNEKTMQETCVTVTIMKFMYQLHILTGDAKYADAFEISLYNAYLGAINTEGCLPSKPKDRKYGINRKSPLFDSYSPLTAGTRGTMVAGSGKISDDGYYGCCISIGSAGIGLVPKIHTLRAKDGIVINLFINGKVNMTTPSGNNIVIHSDTRYPKDGNVKITLNLQKEEQFALYIRNPFWSNETTLSVNAQKQEVCDGYIKIDRIWADGDFIDVSLDMRTKVVYPVPYGEQLLMTKVLWEKNFVIPEYDREDPVAKKHIAFRRGPVMLAQENRLGYSVDEPTDFRLENGYVNANVHTEHTAPYKNIVEVDVPLKNGGNMKLTDYASAGKLWNDESKMAVWMLTC